MTTPLFTAATALTGASLSVIPADPASKKPTLDAWKPFQVEIAGEGLLRDWFMPNGHPPAGALAVICGAVSGGLTVIDFDTLPNGATLYEQWAGMVDGMAPGLLDRLPRVQTPSGGMHVYARCAVCDGNTKLAEGLGERGRRETWIETRGEGGYVVAPLTAGYTTVHGSLKSVPTIAPPELALLLTAARSFNQYVPHHGPHQDTDSLPGAALNAKATLDDMERWLREAGWAMMGARSDGTRLLRRPGKRDAGLSATLGQGGMRTLYVFSSNAAPFEPDTGYSAFAVYTLLHHGGDYAAAARQLAADGYGGARQKKRESSGHKAGRDSQGWQEGAAPEEEWYVGRTKEEICHLDADDLLAPSLIAYTREACEASGFPLEFIMPCVLAATSACVGATAKVRIDSTWLCGAALWIGIVGRPGTGKTPSLDLGLDPVRSMQANWYRQWKEEMAAHQEEMAEWEATDRKLRGQKPQPPRARRILTSDTTIEALVPVFEHNPRGLLLERDELAGWIKSFNQYKKNGGADREHWLSIWSSQPIIVDRKADNFFAFIRDPFMAVVGGIQPGKIRGLVGGVEDGFSDRILLFYPEAAAHGISDVVLSPETRTQFDTLLATLAEMTFDEDAEGNPVPHVFQLDPEARASFSGHLDRMVGLASDPNVTESLANAYTKAGSHAARLALVLHLAQCVDGADMDQRTINARTVRAAWRIVEVAMSHLRRIHAELAVSPQEVAVEKAIGWIERNGGSVTVRDLMVGRCPGCTTASGTKSLLYHLEDRRLGRLATEKPAHGPERLRFTLGVRS